jgi:hypothetical protein
MELIIILLIAVEVVIVRSPSFTETTNSLIRSVQCLIRDGPELWDMLFHSKNEDHGKIVEIKDEPSSSAVTKTV